MADQLNVTLGKRGLHTDPAQLAYPLVGFQILATCAVALRLVLRRRYGIVLKWDDFLIIASLFLSWGTWGMWTYMCQTIFTTPEALRHASSHQAMRTLCMTVDLLYGLGINVIKLAIITFYFRAFSSSVSPRARVWLRTLLALTVAYTIVRVFDSVYVCYLLCQGRNLEAYSVPAFYLSMRAANFALELIILATPIPLLWRVRIPLRQKLAISAVFMLGIITCIAGAIRLFYAIRLYRASYSHGGITSTPDLIEWMFTYYLPELAKLALWSFAELSIGIVTACGPAVRAPAAAAFHSTANTIKRRFTAAYDDVEKNSVHGTPESPSKKPWDPKDIATETSTNVTIEVEDVEKHETTIDLPTRPTSPDTVHTSSRRDEVYIF